MNSNKYILLVGCSGFIGKCIIYLLLKQTNCTLYIVLRSKNGVNINNRLINILTDLNLCKDYSKRIKLIQVEYEKETMNILIDDKDKQNIINNIDCLINGLADINFTRPLIKAIKNNTLTALKWLDLLSQCKNVTTYIYISTAYVNYHLDRQIIEEKIYETNMNYNTLTDILNKKITNIKPYSNTYCYTKQLTEILLTQKRNNINLHILRPSIVCPAYQYPYCGYGELQTINLIFFGIATGTLSFIDIDLNTKFNSIIPVDIVAERCITKITDKNNYTIEHISYNIQDCTSGDCYTIMTNLYYKTLKDNLIIQGKKYRPFRPYMTTNSFYQLISIIHLIIIKLLNGASFYQIYKSLIFTYKYREYVQFIKKDIIFNTKHQYECHDILNIFETYIDKYLISQIELNPLFLKNI